MMLEGEKKVGASSNRWEESVPLPLGGKCLTDQLKIVWGGTSFEVLLNVN